VKTRDGLCQAIAADEAHRIIGPAIGILAKGIDRDDARVFQASRHNCFKHEPGLSLELTRVPAVHLLEGDLAMEISIESDEDLAKATLRVWAQYLEATRGFLAACRLTAG
jgi:hypothetical protein